MAGPIFVTEKTLLKTIKSNLRHLIRTLINMSGYDVCRLGYFSNGRNIMTDLIKLIPDQGCDATLFDIGANKGQTLRRLLAKFPESRIISVEPQADLIMKLHREFDKYKNVIIIEAAIADKEQEKEFHILKHDDSSSFLDIERSATKLYPSVDFSVRKTFPIKTQTLDRIANDYAIDRIDLLKLDIQGYELKALHGAGKLLSAGTIRMVYTEFLVEKMYVGQPTLFDIGKYLDKHGFRLFALYPAWHRAGRLVSGDALFVHHAV